jgi:hypothetical protein
MAASTATATVTAIETAIARHIYSDGASIMKHSSLNPAPTRIGGTNQGHAHSVPNDLSSVIVVQVASQLGAQSLHSWRQHPHVAVVNVVLSVVVPEVYNGFTMRQARLQFISVNKKKDE